MNLQLAVDIFVCTMFAIAIIVVITLYITIVNYKRKHHSAIDLHPTVWKNMNTIMDSRLTCDYQELDNEINYIRKLAIDYAQINVNLKNIHDDIASTSNEIQSLCDEFIKSYQVLQRIYVRAYIIRFITLDQTSQMQQPSYSIFANDDSKHEETVEFTGDITNEIVSKIIIDIKAHNVTTVPRLLDVLKLYKMKRTHKDSSSPKICVDIYGTHISAPNNYLLELGFNTGLVMDIVHNSVSAGVLASIADNKLR